MLLLLNHSGHCVQVNRGFYACPNAGESPRLSFVQAPESIYQRHNHDIMKCPAPGSNHLHTLKPPQRLLVHMPTNYTADFQSSSTSSTLGVISRRLTSFPSGAAAAVDVIGAETVAPCRATAFSLPPFAEPVFDFFPFPFFFSYFHFSLPFLDTSQDMLQRIQTHLLPAPNRPETIKEPDVLEQIRIQPQSRRHRKHRHAK